MIGKGLLVQARLEGIEADLEAYDEITADFAECIDVLSDTAKDQQGLIALLTSVCQQQAKQLEALQTVQSNLIVRVTELEELTTAITGDGPLAGEELTEEEIEGFLDLENLPFK